MPSTDKELYKDKIEVSLDGRQIFYLFFGGAVIASLVFILGVMVGKRVESRSHADQQNTAAVTRDPLAALDQLGTRTDKLAFPSALGDPNAPDRPLGKVDKDWRAKRDRVASAKQNLDSATDSSDKSDKKSDDKKSDDKKSDDKKSDDKKSKKKSDKKTAKNSDEKKSDEPKRKLPKYTLQLSSFQEKTEADAFFQKLTDAGYTPYLVSANVKGKGTWYRVRLGSFMAYDEAIRAKKDFEAGQNVIAYVTRLKRRKR